MKLEIINILKVSWPTIAVVASIASIMRITYIIRSDRRGFCLHEEIFNLLFIVYLILLFKLVTSQEISTGGANLTPFKEILRYKYGSNEFYRQVIGNILLFIPLGYFATGFCKIKGFPGIIIVSLLSSVTIEIVQHFIGRCVDIDDVILNVCGGIFGFLLYIGLNAIKNHLPKIFRKDWFYNLLSILIVILIVLYLIKLF